MEENRQGLSDIVVETRRDGTSVASKLFAKYPCRLHLTSLPDHGEDTDISSPPLPKALMCYALGYGGGLISGDVNILNVTVKQDAKLIYTSQSTAKAFKSIHGRESTVIKTYAKVSKGGLLFLVPQPMQCFGGSVLTQETDVILESCNQIEDQPSLILVDWYTGGRDNMDGGIWQLDSFHTKTNISFCTGDILNNDEIDFKTIESSSDLVFRDSTRLSGGNVLKKHMRNYNIVCMVVLLGPKCKQVASKFMSQYSSRHTYDENRRSGDFGKNPAKHMAYNTGVGLNKDDGLLVSCGKFQTCEKNNYQEGVVIRLAAVNLEVAANFLSEHIGTLDGHLDTDPFLEILASKQGAKDTIKQEKHNSENKPALYNDKFPLDLMSKSYTMNIDKQNELKQTGFKDRNSSSSQLNPLTLFQLIDSCVPSGGFAHSNTLETAHQLHLVNNATLFNHIWDVILNTATTNIPFLLASCNLFREHYHNSINVENDNNDEPLQVDKNLIQKWEQLDRLLKSTTISHVAARASTTQGSGMLRAFLTTFPHISPVVKALKKSVFKVHPSLAESVGHTSTCFGAVCGLLNIDDETCSNMFLYTTARDMVNAAVRMNLIGPLEGGKLTNEVCNAISTLVQKEIVSRFSSVESTHECKYNASVLDVQYAHQVCPLVEILSNAHDRLYTRLFNS